MTSDPDDALHWDGDEDLGSQKPSLPRGWRAVGKGSDGVDTTSDAAQADADVAAAPETTAPETTAPETTAPDTTASGASAPDAAAATEAPSVDDDQPVLSTPALVGFGVLGGIYLLYSVGWFLGGTGLLPRTIFLVPEVMYIVMMWTAVLAPWLWFAATWVLTRRSATWVRLAGLIGGAVLLVPWPFLMTGAGA